MNRNDPNYTNYNNRSADYYMGQIPLDVLDKLTEEDKNSIKSTIDLAIPRPSPKLIDLRFLVDLIVVRYFVVLLVGKDNRRQQRQYSSSGITKFANLVVAILLVIAMSLLISAVTILVAYLIKSALGIDIFSGHITEVFSKFLK
jgi:hypothetical protein